MEWDQRSLWADDRVHLEVRFADLHGWEWKLRHCDSPGGWALLDSGCCGSFTAALLRASEALSDLASGAEGF